MDSMARSTPTQRGKLRIPHGAGSSICRCIYIYIHIYIYIDIESVCVCICLYTTLYYYIRMYIRSFDINNAENYSHRIHGCPMS